MNKRQNLQQESITEWLKIKHKPSTCMSAFQIGYELGRIKGLKGDE